MVLNTDVRITYFQTKNVNHLEQNHGRRVSDPLSVVAVVVEDTGLVLLSALVKKG
jgi:hypothetical protein